MGRAIDVTDEPNVEDFVFTKVLAAVADPIRLSILRQLAQTQDAIRCGAFDLPVKTSTATHHFAALRQAGVIHQYYVGNARMNLLRLDDMEKAYPGFLPAVLAGSATVG